MANFLSPKLKGIHLEESDKLESTKDLIEEEWNKMKTADDSVLSAVGEQPRDPDEDIELSPTSKLRRKVQARSQSTGAQQRRRNRIPPIRREMIQYETFSLAKKDSRVLDWWKDHEPILSKVAKKVLTVPASSERESFQHRYKIYCPHHHGRCPLPPAHHHYNQVGTLSPKSEPLLPPKKLRSCA